MASHIEGEDTQEEARAEGFPISEDMILNAWAQNEPNRHRTAAMEHSHGGQMTAHSTQSAHTGGYQRFSRESSWDGKDQDSEPLSETTGSINYRAASTAALGPRFPDSSHQNKPTSSAAMHYSAATAQPCNFAHEEPVHVGGQYYQPSNYTQHASEQYASFETNAPTTFSRDAPPQQKEANDTITSGEGTTKLASFAREQHWEQHTTQFQVQQPDWSHLMSKLQSVLQDEFDSRSQATWELHNSTISELTQHYESELASWKERCACVENEDESLKAELQQWMRIAERLATTRGLLKRKNVR